jgi:hypothetical protein
MKLSLLTKEGQSIPCTWQVKEEHCTISMTDKSSDIISFRPEFPEGNGKLCFCFSAAVKGMKYFYPEPSGPGLPVADASGKLIEKNIRWIPLNEGGEIFSGGYDSVFVRSP